MPFYGEGLDGLMRARSQSLRGIVNGIDYEEFKMCIRDSKLLQGGRAMRQRSKFGRRLGPLFWLPALIITGCVWYQMDQAVPDRVSIIENK